MARTGIGIGTPGVVDHATGSVSHAPNLVGWVEQVALRRPARDVRCPGTEVRVDNDVNVGVLGEQSAGAAEGNATSSGSSPVPASAAAWCSMDSFGAGPRGVTGEIGQSSSCPTAAAAAVAGRGHLEAYAGRAAIEAEARRRGGGRSLDRV